MLALPIFPGRLQPSIVGRSELNFRVRDGNGWTLALISTNYLHRSRSYKLHYTVLPVLCQALLYHQELPLSISVVTRTGFEPMLKA